MSLRKEFRGIMISIEHEEGSRLPNARDEDWPLFADYGFVEGSKDPLGEGPVHVFLDTNPDFDDRAYVCTKEVDGVRFTVVYFGFGSLERVKRIAAGIYRWNEVVEILERPSHMVVEQLRLGGTVSRREEVVQLDSGAVVAQEVAG